MKTQFISLCFSLALIIISTGYSQIIPDFRVNDDVGNIDQSRSSISIANNGNFVIAWMDGPVGACNENIYAQRYSSIGKALGNNFSVSEGDCNYNPSVSSDSSGNFVITWGMGEDIYAKRYSDDGVALSNRFNVNDSISSVWYDPYHIAAPSISVNAKGNFVITWTDHRYGSNENIYAQRYSSEGVPLGNNFRVNDDTTNTDMKNPSVAIDAMGNFVITWRDGRNLIDWDIYAQRYSSDGKRIGENFQVNSRVAQEHLSEPSLASTSVGDFIIAWNSSGDVYFQRYSSDGIAIGGNDFIDLPGIPSISIDKNDNFIILISDEDSSEKIYGQRFLSNGSEFGDIFTVTEKGLNGKVGLKNGLIYATWTDKRNVETGDDIWANVLDWNDPTDIKDHDISQIPASFFLYQNHPNPFNPSTIIASKLPRSSNVQIEVYNLTGQKVRTLLNKNMSAGRHQINFDAGNLSSGIYFYRINAGEFQDVKKMILIH